MSEDLEELPFLHFHFMDDSPSMMLNTTRDAGVTLHGFCGYIAIAAACGHILLDTYQKDAYSIYLETREMLKIEGNPMGTELSSDWLGPVPDNA